MPIWYSAWFFVNQDFFGKFSSDFYSSEWVCVPHSLCSLVFETADNKNKNNNVVLSEKYSSGRSSVDIQTQGDTTNSSHFPHGQNFVFTFSRWLRSLNSPYSSSSGSRWQEVTVKLPTTRSPPNPWPRHSFSSPRNQRWSQAGKVSRISFGIQKPLNSSAERDVVGVSWHFYIV